MTDQANGRVYGVDQGARDRVHLQHARAFRYTACGLAMDEISFYSAALSANVTCQKCRAVAGDG